MGLVLLLLLVSGDLSYSYLICGLFDASLLSSDNIAYLFRMRFEFEICETELSYKGLSSPSPLLEH